MARRNGATIGGHNLFADFGLQICEGSPIIGGAEPDSKLVYVPALDIPLDLSKSLDGKIHYKQRTITIEVVCKLARKYWPAMQSNLENALQGRWLTCVFDNDPSWEWQGLWRVEPKDRELRTASHTITGTCAPYKRSLTAAAGADWLWDTFNFEEDVICSTSTDLSSL